MSIRSAVASPLWLVVAFALACGGGTSKSDDGTGDEGPDVDTIQPDIPGDEGVKDIVPEDDGTVTPDDRLDVPTDDTTPPKDVIDADAPPPVDVPDVVKDTEQDIPPKMCPCDETITGSTVCLLDGTTKTQFKSDICAKCAVCAPNEFCPDCAGTKTDCSDLPEPNYFSWKGLCTDCPCKLQEECDRLVYPDCGKVCALKGAEQVEYTDLCAMKADFNCSPDFDENLQNFGACPKPVCESCLDQAENPVCGSDGKTYANQCSLVNCPSAAGITRTCLGACVGKDFCPACPATCAPVCGDDNVTYASACAATTCGTKEKKVAYQGACCPECDSDPMVEVCATNGEAYPNQCYALCHGATPCPSAGPADAVCGLDGKDWPNTCWSTCKSGGKLHDGVCTRLCEQCPTTYTPVCATDPDGKLRTYESDCFKNCQGGTGGTAGLCDACTTICANAPAETVCGADGITYPNSCIPQKCMLITFTAGACS